MMLKNFLLLMAFCFGLLACDNNDHSGLDMVELEGSGSYLFKDYPSLANKPLRVYYHIPPNLAAHRPVLIVFHGFGRDAKESRDELMAKANQKEFALLVPEFSNEQYPGGDAYNLGNIFEDGDEPSASSLNPFEEWSFSPIDSMFEDFKNRSGLSATNYDVFGHSAGGQVAHRYGYFWPDAQVNRIVAAASGWYTMPDFTVDFPYGLKESPLQGNALARIFAKPVYIVVGLDDNDPNAASLRSTPEANEQGDNRLARAQYYYQESAQLANEASLNYAWQFKSLTGVAHDFRANALYAADLLY